MTENAMELGGPHLGVSEGVLRHSHRPGRGGAYSPTRTNERGRKPHAFNCPAAKPSGI